jgi:hypothetical protein
MDFRISLAGAETSKEAEMAVGVTGSFLSVLVGQGYGGLEEKAGNLGALEVGAAYHVDSMCI